MPPASATGHTVDVVDTGDAHRAVATIMRAFATDPMSRWCLPDDRAYAEHFPTIIHGLGGGAFTRRTGYQVDDFVGAALWLPPGVEPDQETMSAVLGKAVPAERREDVYGVIEQMAQYHPHDPHWYLPLIGVDPTRQGQGLGSALLRHTLAFCDRDRLPAYLESSNPINVPLYERHGFRILGTIQHGASPAIVPMLREPR